MAYQSEAELERQLIEQLVDLRFQRVYIKDENELWANFRIQFFKHNEQALEGRPLTDREFERVRAIIEGKSIFQSSKILRDKFVIEREDETKVHLELFNSRHWCKNHFQVTSQVTMVGTYENRYDVTLLINGLPLVQIELKRRGLDMKEAFNQINRYKKHSFKGLFNYIQIFVISNGVDTKYFANSDQELLYSQTFFWTNAKNERITQLSDFALSFLEPCQIAKMIARFMVLHETKKVPMVMRPYQVYAVEHLITRALETSNNGYIWHTTGSGKTLTSFKVSQVLGKETQIKKVFFLVDRKDLDGQTIREFNAFEKDCIDSTERTDKLVEQIKGNGKLIVTTIQKMANALKNPKYSEVMKNYQNEKVVFVIDECHRSQFGKMHKEIQNYFKQAQYFGFTGTPRFKVNRSQDGRVTADLFGSCLHHYLIKDAIHDKNVLGFSVEYIKTIENHSNQKDSTKVSTIDTEEVIMEDERLKLISQHILNSHHLKTRNRQYNSIFATEKTEMLIKYYKLFKEQTHDLKIAAIFTFGQNEESEGKETHSRDELEIMIHDYNQLFGTAYSTDTFDQYFVDVSKRLKEGDIDILLVVDMFLTGFDADGLNTLYVDKPLKYHNLIQAFSRTNRIEKSTKPYGNVVCYRNLKEETDAAIRLFSQTDSTDIVLMKSYEDYLSEFTKGLEKLLTLTPNPQSVDELESEDEMKAFVLAFRELSRTLTKLQTFVDFLFTEEQIGLSEQMYQDFKSKYFLIYEQVKGSNAPKTSILADIDFCIELIQTDRINVAYILRLIRELDLKNPEETKTNVQNILNLLSQADHPNLRLKIELIKQFLQKVVPTLKPTDDIDEAYQTYEREQELLDIQTFAQEMNLEVALICKFLTEYRFAGRVDHSFISEHIKAKFMEKKEKIERVKQYLANHIQKYE